MTTSVTAGCDPHKLTLTLAAVDQLNHLVDEVSVENSAAGIEAVLKWLAGFDSVARVGIEGSAGHGAHLGAALVAAGHDVREVPSRRTAQRRRERRRPKTDREDAFAIARATAAEPTLGPCRAGSTDPVIEELDAVNDWRNDLVEQRKRLINRVESLLGKLPVEFLDEIGRTGKTITRARAGAVMTSDDPPTQIRLRHLRHAIDNFERLSEQIRAIEVDLRRLVRSSNTTLRDEVGIDWVLAARLLTEIVDPTRFRTEAAFARWCGVAAVAISSGEGNQPPTRHRLDLGGNRRVNSVLHIASVVQGRCHPDAKIFLDRKRTEGKTPKEARRAHKRRLADRVIRRMWRDTQPQTLAA